MQKFTNDETFCDPKRQPSVIGEDMISNPQIPCDLSCHLQAKKTQRGMTSNVTFHRVKRKRPQSQREDDASVIDEGSVIEIQDDGNDGGGKVVGLRRGKTTKTWAIPPKRDVEMMEIEQL